ncbi:sugar transferase [Devosia sp. YIM 151766]|uniref:sugar transferase n=1 Tax=Devosia sp. YIM 151766 TaxID=3017325 RepID=UPI00255D08A2|nr:sugar transferase [Devosia sp. YIM 151766]WIY51568.1 sugar transferase [Devosia sp. YIM 151766]
MTLYDQAWPVTAAARDPSVFAGRQQHELHLSQSGLPLRLSDMAAPGVRWRRNSISKRTIDVVLALAGLILLSPLFLVLAILIKRTSPGPVFFRQQREGLDGKLFGVYKFRSMRTELGDQSGLRQAVGGDPRITRLGRFMRRTSLDEMPQLINVLFGDMSLIGPRPHVPGMLAAGMPYRDLAPYYDDRHRVRPGLTGWAQVNGLRGPTTEPQLALARIHHDLAYIQNWSLCLDCRILALTLWRELSTGTGS